MNAADLARLELAKRAYKATQAGEAEVQTGVRRARLALTRPKRRRNWFSKGLVFVVLAVGSLAYAKPNAIGEIVEKVLPRDDSNSKRGAGGRLAELAAPIEEAAKLGHARVNFEALGAATLKREVEVAGTAETSPLAAPEVEATTAGVDAPTKQGSKSAARSTNTATSASSTNTARTNSALTAALAKDSAGSSDTAANVATKTAPPTSSWGRVGRALADGNQSEALAALDLLSASGDERTRDKADLGRAQLLMSQGETTAACSLASSLTHRRAGSRIERQAQLLLKNCR